jgi:hypothetical protein
MDLFFIAATKEADDRATGRAIDLESYIAIRRDTSGCKPCFALIEYAALIDLPDKVMSHPVIMAMEEASNDLVTWSNVMPHYVVECLCNANIIADRISSLTTRNNLVMTQIT